MNSLTEKYFKMSNDIFRYGLSPIQLAVYSFLVSLAGSKEKCWPSMKTIAAYCNCSETSARNAVGILQEKKLIRKTATYCEGINGKSRQANNTYFILDLPPVSQVRVRAIYHTPAEAGGE